MEFKNIEQLYSSEHSHIFLVEGSDGRLYTKKDRGISPEVADKLRGIKSPYVAALADHGDDFTILEYAQGTPLNDLKLTSGRACEIFRELCDGVLALHSVGILHRDIKPSNVIVCDDGHIKIIDFDAARIKKPTADKDTVFMGTDGFAPPEQFGFTQTDERSDIYALGITLKVVLGEKYQNSRYRRIIKKCIRFNPEQRYRSIEDVKKAITFNDCVLGSIALAVRNLKCIIHADLSKNNIPDETFNDQISIHNTSATDRERKILIEEPSTKRIIINRFQKDMLDENALSTQTMKTKHIIFNNEKIVKSTSYTLSISSAPIHTRIPPRIPSLIISVRSVSLPQVKPPSSMIIKQTDFKTYFDSRQK